MVSANKTEDVFNNINLKNKDKDVHHSTRVWRQICVSITVKVENIRVIIGQIEQEISTLRTKVSGLASLLNYIKRGDDENGVNIVCQLRVVEQVVVWKLIGMEIQLGDIFSGLLSVLYVTSFGIDLDNRVGILRITTSIKLNLFVYKQENRMRVNLLMNYFSIKVDILLKERNWAYHGQDNSVIHWN